MSGRGLARRLGKSEGYVRDRLNGTYEFSISDVERFALFIGMNPEDFVGAIDRDALSAEMPERDREYEPTTTLRDILGGKSNVTDIRSHSVGTKSDDEPGVKQPPAKQRTAARKGTRKADTAPHAD